MIFSTDKDVCEKELFTISIATLKDRYKYMSAYSLKMVSVHVIEMLEWYNNWNDVILDPNYFSLAEVTLKVYYHHINELYNERIKEKIEN